MICKSCKDRKREHVWHRKSWKIGVIPGCSVIITTERHCVLPCFIYNRWLICQKQETELEWHLIRPHVCSYTKIIIQMKKFAETNILNKIFCESVVKSQFHKFQYGRCSKYFGNTHHPTINQLIILMQLCVEYTNYFFVHHNFASTHSAAINLSP